VQVLLDNPQYQTSFLGIDPHIKYRLTTQTNLSRYCTTSRTAITRESGCAIFTVYRRMRCAPRTNRCIPRNPSTRPAPNSRMQPSLSLNGPPDNSASPSSLLSLQSVSCPRH
jgi:hypothetical protein